MNSVFDQIREDELTDDLKLVSKVVGIDAVRKILKDFGGLSFYIPKLTRLDGFVDRYMKQNRNKTAKQIALDLGVSEHYLRSVRKRFGN